MRLYQLKKRWFCFMLPIFVGITLSSNAQQDATTDYFIADHNYVKVYYGYLPLVQTKNMSAMMANARGFWDVSETVRKNIVAETFYYKAIASLQAPGLDTLETDGINLLGKKGIWIEAVGRDGKKYSSLISLKKARQNTWRTGSYYSDIHLMDFTLADKQGDTLAAKAELILHAFPDKILVEARVTPQNGEVVKSIYLKGWLSEDAKTTAFPGIVEVHHHFLGVWNGKITEKKMLAAFVPDKADPHILKAGFGFFIGRTLKGTVARRRAETHPLPRSSFKIKNGYYKGFDRYSGLYLILNEVGESAGGFNAFRDNPNMYLNVGVNVKNDHVRRKLYFKHASSAGPIEAAILTDDDGFPLPIQVEACKNFEGENEEPDDSPFNESYFPITLAPEEAKSFHSLHLEMNWGNHALRQVSSIRFFQIYYHLSQGVTETTCFSLRTKVDKIPSGAVRAYTLSDYRPLDGQMWPGSPQHHHVALQGWLQYLDSSGKWRYPYFQGSQVYSVGPNLAWFSLDYVSSDNKVDEHFDIFEMPQTDRSRTFLRCTYRFKKDVVIKGDPSKNFRLLNKGSYIRKVHWKKLAWTAPDGTIKTGPMTNDEKWSVVGQPLRHYDAFFCAYPYIDGNDALVIRNIGGTINGHKQTNFGFSAVGHKDGSSELMLSPLIKGNVIKAGSELVLDVILIPYGDDASNWMPPYEESVRYGLNDTEAKRLGIPDHASEFQNGIALKVLHGKKISNLPPVVRAKNNWAEVEMKGGNSLNSLVAIGFRHPKLPMLWKDDEYLDFQAMGGDGYEAFTGNDSTYGFVFTPELFTSRANDEWGTRHSHFYITQAWSEGEITKVSAQNGRVALQIQGKGKTTIMSPRIWCPAINQCIEGPIMQAESDSKRITTVPIKMNAGSANRRLEVKQYSPEAVNMTLTNVGKTTLHLNGLAPLANYSVRLGGLDKKMKTDAHGTLLLDDLNKSAYSIALTLISD
jgi:hypothetical protein